jgi:hypothetical protein
MVNSIPFAADRFRGVALPMRLRFLVVVAACGFGCAPRYVARPGADFRRADERAFNRFDSSAEPEDEPSARPAAPESPKVGQPVLQAPDESPSADDQSVSRAPRQRLLEAARSHLGKRFRGDCSTFVRRVYAEAGLRFEPMTAGTGSEAVLLAMQPVERPRPGDVAFFRDTYGWPRGPGKGRRLTHVAVVEEVDGTTVTLIHRGHRGIARITLDLARPHDKSVNSQIRIRHRNDRKGLEYLSGELLTGFAVHREIVALEEVPVS